MEEQFIEDFMFKKKDFSENALDKGEYELCTFINCNFSNSNLSQIRFIDCKFYECNLSTANIFQTGFQNALLKNVKC